MGMKLLNIMFWTYTYYSLENLILAVVFITLIQYFALRNKYLHFTKCCFEHKKIIMIIIIEIRSGSSRKIATKITAHVGDHISP